MTVREFIKWLVSESPDLSTCVVVSVKCSYDHTTAEPCGYAQRIEMNKDDNGDLRIVGCCWCAE